MHISIILRGGEGQALPQFTAADGLDVGNVTAIHRAAGQVLSGGEVGLSQLHVGRFYSIRTEGAVTDTLPRSEVNLANVGTS